MQLTMTMYNDVHAIVTSGDQIEIITFVARGRNRDGRNETHSYQFEPDNHEQTELLSNFIINYIRLVNDKTGEEKLPYSEHMEIPISDEMKPTAKELIDKFREILKSAKNQGPDIRPHVMIINLMHDLAQDMEKTYDNK